jgi:tRNA threonylcarbamoyladenosine biosynthesis protein TsaB
VLTLAFDTSSRTGSIAVLRDRNTLGEIANASGDPYSITFFADLDKLLAQVNLSLHQFDLFAVGAGPGSFTGLRTGLAAAKAWAEIYGKPIAAVSCLAALASKIDPSRFSSPKPLIAALLDARRGQIFGCVYRFVEGFASAPPTVEPITDEVVLSADEFVEIVKDLTRRVAPDPRAGISEFGHGAAGAAPVFVSSSPQVIRAALERSSLSGSPIEEVSGALAAQIGELGYLKAARGEVVDALSLEANYIRRPDAERNWKGP